MDRIATMLELRNVFSADSKKMVFCAKSSVFSPTELKGFYGAKSCQIRHSN
jgi:hypothetical protein